jgi:hypothetical protein
VGGKRISVSKSRTRERGEELSYFFILSQIKNRPIAFYNPSTCAMS